MPEIHYQSMKEYIRECADTVFPCVHLIFGEAFLYQQMTRDLVSAILPDAALQKHNYEVINHLGDGQISDLIERINTYSFFSEKKILELRDASVFIAAYNKDKTLERIRHAYEKEDFEKSARLFLLLLSRMQQDLSDLPEHISDGMILDIFRLADDQTKHIAWIRSLCAYCRERRLPVPEASDDAERLKNAIEKGFPKNHFLIITTDTIDKRKALYKAIKQNGTVIDCAIPKGNRKVDQDAQRQFLQQYLHQHLKKYKKKADTGVFDRIFQHTGFDVRAFAAGVDKLIDYSGNRARIGIADVDAVLIRTRQDPIYELTGALSERDALKTRQYVASLLASGFHYLQILTAMINQIRKLLLIKGFQQSPEGRQWHPKMRYDAFKKSIIPLILTHDAALADRIDKYPSVFNNKKPPLKKSSKKSATDLRIVPQANNPYPVFQQFLRAANYSKEDLFTAIETLQHADVKLKTTGQSPETVLEEVVFKICAKSAGSADAGIAGSFWH